MKTICFIDAGTLRLSVVKEKLRLNENQKFDWKLFMKWIGTLTDTHLFDTHYYDAVANKLSDGLNGFHNFLRDELHIQLHLTTLRVGYRNCPECKSTYSVDEQKGVDVAIALDIVKLAPFYERAILVSGDGDFADVARLLRSEYGKQIIIVGWTQGISPDLRSAANQTTLLEDHQSCFITRTDIN